MGNIQVRVSNGQFLLNGVATQLRMRTSFKWLGYLWHDDPHTAERWLERVKDQGFHGIRVFGEYHFWDEGFFKLYPTLAPWDLGQVGGSQFKMSPKHKQVLELALSLLRKHDLIMEYTVIATLKGSAAGDPRKGPDIVGWNSHAMRVTAEFFREIEATNVLAETINEFDAHIVGEMQVRDGHDWRIVPVWVNGELSSHYLSEMTNEARRWKIRDWPGSPIGISHGGRWDIKYPVGPHANAFTHVNIHSPRHANWVQVGPFIEDLRRMNSQAPVYLNENMHYMTQEQWDKWTPIHAKWRSLSTTDAAMIQSQWNSAYQHGASYCVHDIVGMAADPNEPWTPVEHMHKEQFSPDPPPPPPGPPEPPPPGPSTGFWRRVLDLVLRVLKSFWEMF